MTDARRINSGSGHRYEIGGEKVPGVTSILSAGIPKGALVNWAAECSARYAVNHWDELAAMPVADRLDPIVKARHEERNKAAARGTRIHGYAERLLAGEEVDVPDDFRGHVDQCLTFLAAWDIQEIAVEVTVVNRARWYMGTADLLARVGDSLDVWLFDWKTGKPGIWPETALQLAAYAHAETMLVPGPEPDGFSEIAFPQIACAAAVDLQPDTYEVRPVDISDETFFTFLYAQQVARFTTADRADYVGPPLDAPLFDELEEVDA
jgi:hypothetical protein